MKREYLIAAVLIAAFASLALADIRPLTWGGSSLPLPDGSVAVLADSGVTRSDPIPLCVPGDGTCATSATWAVDMCCTGSSVAYHTFDGGILINDGGVCADGGLNCPTCGTTCLLDAGIQTEDGGFFSTGALNLTVQLEGSIDQQNWFVYPNTSQNFTAASTYDGGNACISWIQTQLMPWDSVQWSTNNSDGGVCQGSSSTW